MCGWGGFWVLVGGWVGSGVYVCEWVVWWTWVSGWMGGWVGGVVVMG